MFEVGSSKNCFDGGLIVMFNFLSGEWMDEYYLESFDDYVVLIKVQDKIGGNGVGGVILVIFFLLGWDLRGFGEVFGEFYNMKKIISYGFYNMIEFIDCFDFFNDGDDDEDGGGGGFLLWVVFVFGVIIGLIVIVIVIVFFCFWKCCGIFKN